MVSREFSDSREQATHIYLDGAVIFNPRHIVVKDPWSGVKILCATSIETSRFSNRVCHFIHAQCGQYQIC